MITITRQYGSGGLAVAEAVAKSMGVKCYNRDIVVQAASNIKNFEDIKDVIAEAYETPNNFVAKLSFLAGQGVPRQNQMFNEQERVIFDIAQEGSAVFVGRCADYILRHEPNCYSFFICADDDYRREKVKEVYKDLSLQDVRDVEKIKAVLEVAAASGKKYQVGFNRRFDHNFRAIRKAVEAGKVGK